MGLNIIGSVAKNRPNIISSLSDSIRLNLKKFLKILYSNIIELDKYYKSIYLFPNLVSINFFFIEFKLSIL